MMLNITPYLISHKPHPLFYQTLMCILGIATQAWLSTPYVFIAGLTITIAHLVCSFLLKNKAILLLSLLPLMFTCGALRYHYQQKDHLDFRTLIGNKTFNVSGHITDISFLEQSRMKWCITLQTNTVQVQNDNSEIHYLKKTVQLYTLKKPSLQVQDLIEVKNLTLNPCVKDSYNNYLIKEDIAATLFLIKFDHTLVNRPTNSLKRWLFYFKKQLLYQCKAKLSPQTFAFFSSVFLGNRQWGKKQMEKPKEHCKTWGISHYLARSGLHMVIFVFAWHTLLNLLPISLVYKDIFLIFLSILYYIFSWTSISFIRAFFSFILYKSCSILKVPSQLLHLLTIVTMFVLLLNPMQLFFLDFQLSFGLTFALAWFNQIHHKAYQTNP